MKMIKNMVMLAALTMTAPLAAETTETTETENAAPATVAEIASGVCAGCHWQQRHSDESYPGWDNMLSISLSS